jgi:hypothetical protein
MSYATVRWRWRVYEMQATWRDGKLEADEVAKLLLAEWDQRARGLDTSGLAAPSVRFNHLTTIPSFLGLVRAYADSVVSVQTDHAEFFGSADKQAIY